MKQGHFAILFLVIYVFCFMALTLEQHRYDEVLEEKEKLEHGLKMAVEQTAQELIKVLKEPIAIQEQVVEEVFFETIYVAFDVLDDETIQGVLKAHIPLLVLLTEEGIVFYHARERVSHGVNTMEYIWSDFVEFDELEGYITGQRQIIVTEYIEKVASEKISKHNFIARQYGLDYEFHVPSFFGVSDEFHVPMVIAVFQGWPLNSNGTLLYENCVDAGGYLQEVKKYVVEIPNSIENTYSYFHEENCELVVKGERYFLKEKMSEKEALETFGAIPCDECVK